MTKTQQITQLKKMLKLVKDTTQKVYFYNNKIYATDGIIVTTINNFINKNGTLHAGYIDKIKTTKTKEDKIRELLNKDKDKDKKENKINKTIDNIKKNIKPFTQADKDFIKKLLSLYKTKYYIKINNDDADGLFRVAKFASRIDIQRIKIKYSKSKKIVISFVDDIVKAKFTQKIDKTNASYLQTYINPKLLLKLQCNSTRTLRFNNGRGQIILNDEIIMPITKN